jgi:hypothetical protein
MNYNLFLDDQRVPRMCADFPGDESLYDSGRWIIERNFESFVERIKTQGIPENVSFDYQLNAEKDGLDCAKFLVDFCKNANAKFPKYRVHSSWPGIAQNFFELIGEKQTGF